MLAAYPLSSQNVRNSSKWRPFIKKQHLKRNEIVKKTINLYVFDKFIHPPTKIKRSFFTLST